MIGNEASVRIREEKVRQDIQEQPMKTAKMSAGKIIAQAAHRAMFAVTMLALVLPAGSQTARPSSSGQGPAKANGGAIHVEGHWLLELQNPDGTIADRRDFYNHLTNQEGLAYLLSGIASQGFVEVQVTSTTPAITFLLVPPKATCTPTDSTPCVTTLSSGLPSATFSTTIPGYSEAYTITQVKTVDHICVGKNFVQPAVTDPALCLIGNVQSPDTMQTQDLTFTTLATPMSVALNQAVRVTVTISFH